MKRGPVKLTVAPWDVGPRTPSQDANKVVEAVTYLCERTGRQVNPNGVYRVRRETWVGRYLRRGVLTARQAAVAIELAEAAEGYRCADPMGAVRVDCGGDGRDPNVAFVDARRKFRAMWRCVPAFAAPVLEHVVLRDCSLRSMPGCSSGPAEARHRDRLQRGLDALADAWSAPRRAVRVGA